MKTLPNIALISVHSDPASETGSQNVYVRQMGEALSRLGWQVDMFTRKTSNNQQDLVQHSDRCRTIRLSAGALHFVPRQKLIGYLPEFVSQLRQFQLANKICYSLIHTNYWLSAWVGMELKKTQPLLRHVHTYHSLGALKYAKTRRIANIARTRIAIEKLCLETADLSIATCPQQRDYLETLVSRRGNIAIVPCGTDTKTFGSVAKAIARQNLAIESNVFNILYVGRFNHRQGIETLVKAVSKPSLHGAAKIRLTLVSNSSISNQPERGRIEQLVWDLGIDNITTFTEGVSRSELATHYAAADVCVVPNYYNASGMVALEAMASGTPVIASNVGGLKYIVEHQQTGLLFPARNVTLLTQSIQRVATQPELCVKLGHAAQDRVEELFTWTDVANQMSEFYWESITAQNLQLLDRSFKHPLQPVSA